MHPFKEAFACSSAEVEEVVPSPDHPDGLKFSRPCRCPAFLRLQQEETVGADESGNIVKVRREISGCRFRLAPWMESGAVQQSNAVLAEVAQLRKETLEVGRLAIEAIRLRSDAGQQPQLAPLLQGLALVGHALQLQNRVGAEGAFGGVLSLKDVAAQPEVGVGPAAAQGPDDAVLRVE